MNRPTTLTCSAPAKLNLFLHITGRRDDGMHLLQTVFQLLDFGDELSFDLRSDGKVTRDYDLPGVSEEQDLVIRAAQLLKSHCGVEQGVSISLEKRLPAGGGLGGGSSDAATTLVALDHLWNCQLGLESLAELGQQLGADVPVFIYGKSAWAEGIGEQLEPIMLPDRWYVVIFPGIHVSTAHVFGSSRLNRDCPAITIRDFLAGQGSNVFEEIVREDYPDIARAFDALSEYGQPRLTGTGACLFVQFMDEAAANQCWSALSANWQGFVARGVNESPLHTQLEI